LRLLEQADLAPLSVVPVTGPLLEPVGLFLVKNFGDFFMVRAANMKRVVEKKARRIVNVSGGGCPDVPYLAQQMVGQSLGDAHSRRDRPG
jgi:hypothetical protein